MFDPEALKYKFYRIARDAENNARKDKLKAPKAPPVYEPLHDISLARYDLYSLLATSSFTAKHELVGILNKMLEGAVKSEKAFNEEKYSEAFTNMLKNLLTELRQ